MLKVAITGNIGTGKTTVCKIFESLGIPVYYADKEAKKFYKLPEVIHAIKQLFGSAVFGNDDKLIPSNLADIVFHDQIKLKQLNAIIHPLVLDDVFEWTKTNLDQNYILYESALLFESGFIQFFDKSILVTAPLETAISRVMARDGISEADVRARANMQQNDQEKAKLADFIISNDEGEALIPKVLDIHMKLNKTL